MGRVKRKSPFDHAQNVQIQIIMCMRKVSSGPYALYYPIILLADREYPDQTARMRRLIWAFAVRICTKIRFSMARLL